jgi:catechol 2,3-dioxygenase-like lactoylglutathione lyase family enzyme
MNQYIAQIALLVNDYDEAIDFYTKRLNFRLVEDTQLSPDKRWVVMTPQGDGNSSLLFAKAANEEQKSCVGNQSGGRVFLFLNTDDFGRDYNAMKAHGVIFVREPVEEHWGMVAVFKDLYGNLWDLIEPKSKEK